MILTQTEQDTIILMQNVPIVEKISEKECISSIKSQKKYNKERKDMMDTSIHNLSNLMGRVYVYFDSPELCLDFYRRAEEEGFRFTDGMKPTEKHCSDLVAVNAGKTLNFVTTTGRIAYGSGAKTIGDARFYRVDYRKYISGDLNYCNNL